MSCKRPLPGQKQNLLFYLNIQPSEKRQMDQPTVYLSMKYEEGLQEPDRDSTQHIARGDDHRVRTSSHVSTRTRTVQ